MHSPRSAHSVHRLLLLGACALAEVAWGQSVGDRLESRPPSGCCGRRSRQIPWVGDGGSIVSIASIRSTPPLTFPMRVRVVPSSAVLHLTIPPATPAGNYAVEVTGRNVARK